MSRISEEMSENASKLIELARKKFGKLNKAEKKLFCHIADGEVADYSVKKGKDNNPSDSDKWGSERVLDADRIVWLCIDQQVSAIVTYKGISVKGARIDGELNLVYARISFPLYFEKSAFTGGIYLRQGEIRSLCLSGTHTGPIDGEGLKVEGGVDLCDGFEAEGKVRLYGATIGGSLDCRGGQFINKNSKALVADGLNVNGSIFLNDGFKAEGQVRLYGATIRVNLDCINGCFINHNAEALNAERLNVNGSVFLSENFKAEGEVRLYGATIGGSLDCQGGQFINKNSKALVADGLNVNGSIFLNGGFKSEGQVRLYGATIRVNLDCIKGWFINRNAEAINAERLDVNGSVFLDDFKAEGEVNLVGATIGGKLNCKNGRFINPNRIALQANSLHVKNNAYFDKFMVEGEFSLVDAEINGFFYWMGLASRENVRLDLRSAKVGTLHDEKESWPGKGELFLHGLVYNEIHDNAPRDTERRIDWLQRQYDDKAEKNEKQFRPQPYEQLTAVLRKSGQDEDARKILIAKNKDRARLTELTTWSEKLWYRVLGPRIGYGYRPLNALWGVLVFVVLGWFFFGIGYRGGLITPHSESAYVERSFKNFVLGTRSRELSDVHPKFNFLVYSVDTFVPLIDLHQSKYWLPNANLGAELFNIQGITLHTGGLLRLYLCIHIVMGWVLTTLLVVGLTGLVRT